LAIAFTYIGTYNYNFHISNAAAAAVVVVVASVVVVAILDGVVVVPVVAAVATFSVSTAKQTGAKWCLDLTRQLFGKAFLIPNVLTLG
jgi:hypothetical protein